MSLLLLAILGCTPTTPKDTDTGSPSDTVPDSCDTSPIDTDPTDTDPADEALPGTAMVGSTPRNLSPSTADLPQLACENADFSLDFLRELYDLAPDNIVASPYSLQSVMAQVWAGADGDAKTAIATALRWTLAEPAFHEAFDALDLAIAAHHDSSGDPPVEIISTNQIFLTEGYELGAAWLDILSEYYGTGAQVMDFEADPAGVAADINAWISARTGGRIEDLVSEQGVAASRMLLINTLYFKASWYVPFDESSTSDLPFALLDGSHADVPTMSGSVAVRGAPGDGFYVADLPYTDDGLSMTLVIPDAGRFNEILGSLEWPALQAAIASEVGCEACEVTLPLFEIDGRPPIQDALVAMGMEAAFGGSYPGISESLTLTAIAQAAFVAVDEEGTEAAAATKASFSDTGSAPALEPIVVDRPFLWFVREDATNAILFSGLVVDPR